MSANGSIRTRSVAASVRESAEKKMHATLDTEPVKSNRPKVVPELIDDVPEGATMSLNERETRIAELRRLPTMSVEDAAMVLGISRASAFKAVERGEIQIKRVGKRHLVLTRVLFRELDGDFF